MRRADKIHAFLVDRNLCRASDDGSREIVLDPPYTQFLESGECLFEDSRTEAELAGRSCYPDDLLAALPRVFIGTRDDLVALYRRFQSRLRSASASGLDPDTGRYEPASLASLHCSFGTNASPRTNVAFDQP